MSVAGCKGTRWLQASGLIGCQLKWVGNEGKRWSRVCGVRCEWVAAGVRTGFPGATGKGISVAELAQHTCQHALCRTAWVGMSGVSCKGGKRRPQISS